MAPATLVFHDVADLQFDFHNAVDEQGSGSTLEVADIVQGPEKRWTIQFHHGYLGFTATGFRQYIRKAPSFELGQQVSQPRRGGTTFERVTGEAAADLFSFAEFRTTATWRWYQLKLEQARVRHQLDQLLAERAAGHQDLKSFLLQKQELQHRINSLGLEIQDLNS